MNQPVQLNDTNIQTNTKMFWSAMQASAPMFLVVVYLMHSQSIMDPILPDLRNIFIGLCIISIVAPFIFLGHFKRLQNKIRDNVKIGIDNEPAELQRYFSFLVIGMALCELPAMFGLVLYITVGDLFYSLFFIGLSFFLGFLYKPELS